MKNNIDQKDQKRLIELIDQILWQNRKSYIELCEQYFNSKIDSEEVVDNFFVLHRNHNNESGGLLSHPERLKKIQIISKSERFSDVIEDMFCACEALDVEETNDNSGYPISENRFRKELSLVLQKLKDSN
jgi:hypothetical protein